MKRLLALIVEAPHLALSAFILGILLQGFVVRVGYPFDLEWMEGGMLTHGLRVQRGLPLYVEPSADFIPYIYPPLYPWALGWLGKVAELGYPLGRTISLVGTLFAAGLLALAVRGEGRGWALGLGGAALYLSTYDETGTFFDVVRADGLMVGLLAGALVAGRHGRLAAAGLLLTAAYLAKHNAAAFGLPILLWQWRYRGRGAMLRFAAWSVLPALAATAAVQLSGDRLFLTYLLGVPGAHGYVPARIVPGTPRELWGAMPWTNAAALAAGLLGLARRGEGQKIPEGAAYWLGVGAVALLLCGVMRGHVGGYINVLMPGMWAVAALSALGVGALRDALAAGAAPETRGRLARCGLIAALLPLAWNGLCYGIQASGAVDALGPKELREWLAAVVEAGAGEGGVDLLPWRWWLALAAAAAFLTLPPQAAQRPGARPAIAALTSLLIAGQLWDGRWDPGKYLPSDKDRAAGEALIAELAATPGEILAPQFAWYPVLAGKEPAFHLIALWDIDHEGGPLDRDARRISRAIADKRFAAILVGNRPLKYGTEQHYRQAKSYRKAMEPVTGWQVYPRYLYVPNDDGDAAPAPGPE